MADLVRARSHAAALPADAQRLLGAAPPLGGQPQPGYAEAHNNLGFALAGRGDLDEAITHYRKALESDSENAGFHYNLAMALVARGQARPAIAHLFRAVELQPEFVQARNNLGILLARSGRLDEAIEQFRQALEIEPGSAEVRRNLDIAGRRPADAAQ